MNQSVLHGMSFQVFVEPLLKNHHSQGLPKTGKLYNIAMENGPFEDVFPINNGDIPLLC